MERLELWGGAECTVNRVGNAFGDQLVATGHHDRETDMLLFAEMGMAAVRFPVLWERVAPDHPDQRDWSWSDPRLAQLQSLGIRPIVGLIHHGSGPRYTSLIDESFATGLAAHALEAARRYPWVEEWTPVNEPLTTARFSALYGHWYPHERDERAFWLALLNQIDATRLSMKAIRTVNPNARLIQTDDLGRTYATARLSEQAAFDNTRRWMSWDLLCGLVTPKHPLWDRLAQFGFAERLQVVADDPCIPSVIGLNHYLTSDRFLDHRIQRYPEHTRGGNGKLAFADVEAIRTLAPAPGGWRTAIADAWERYGLPIALTEVHNGCTREEQVRWLAETWETATQARHLGMDVRALTAWAVFGNKGWNNLLTAPGLYESGVYDVRGGKPRPTALSTLLTSLSAGAKPATDACPPFGGAGWWRRNTRLHHAAVPRPARISEHIAPSEPESSRRPLLITGATGTLGKALARAAKLRNLPFVVTGRSDLDLDRPATIFAALEKHRPWAVINASGWVRVDDAELEPEACMKANAEGAADLARACADLDIRTVNFSSDLVFDGRKGMDYGESDSPSPINVYGRSKARMEERISALPGAHLIIRTAAFFSPFDAFNFAIHVDRTLARGDRFGAADAVVSPTYVPDLCDGVLDLLMDGEQGLWHLSSGVSLSWADFAQRVALACGRDPSLVDVVPMDLMDWRARRPEASGLISEKGRILPLLEAALDRFSRHREPAELVT